MEVTNLAIIQQSCNTNWKQISEWDRLTVAINKTNGILWARGGKTNRQIGNN